MGAPVIPMVAARREGTQELLRTIVDIAEGGEKLSGINLQYGRDVEKEIAKLEKLISETSIAKTYSPRWLAVKLLEEDKEIISKIRRV